MLPLLELAICREQLMLLLMKRDLVASECMLMAGTWLGGFLLYRQAQQRTHPNVRG